MTNCPHILTPNSLTILKDGKSFTILKDNQYFEETLEALKEKNWAKVVRFINKAQAIHNFAEGRITVKDNGVFFNGELIKGNIVDRILMFVDDNLEPKPLINFLDKIMDNPSKRCVEKLLAFLEHGNMPIDEDGDFYAYKAVTSGMKDKHTGKIDNSIGAIVQVQRNTVDDIPEHDCSYGLHAGTLQYVKHFQNEYDNDTVVIVKINPADVVTVPENDVTKLRCCKYKVISIYDGPLPETVYHDESTTEDIKDVGWCDTDTCSLNRCTWCQELSSDLCSNCNQCDACCECDNDYECECDNDYECDGCCACGCDEPDCGCC